MSPSGGRSIHPYKKEKSGLFKIMAVIVTLLLVAGGAIQASIWLQDKLTERVENSAGDNLAEARTMLESGDHNGAIKALEPILERVDNPQITPEAILIKADVQFEAGNDQEGLKSLNEILSRYPSSPEAQSAAIRVAQAYESDERFDEAVELYAQVRETAPSTIRAPATSALARQMEREGEIQDAVELYREASDEAEWGSDAWVEAVDGLGRLNTDLLFSNLHTPDSKVYTVTSGDSLTSIGSKLNITMGQLMRANGIDDPNKLRPNQVLKYTPKDFKIVIERSTCRIYLLDSQGIFKMYQTGLGKQGYDTTLGKYKIGNKEKDPTWHKPGSEPIPGGDPENELGSRWLPLIPEEENLPRDLGIHGTIEPDSIGTYASKGCPRMHNAEVEELYDLVVRSTPVEIVETYNPRS